jgi:dTDP-4-amino-4,6-dideoxygalactose transaminase
MLVTADGGMVFVKDPALAERARKLTYLGLESASGFSQAGAANRWWEFEISSFSRRSIINDVTAAMGLVQLARLPGFIARRREVHERYDRLLAGLDWLELPPAPTAGSVSSYYFYWLQTEPELRDRLAQHLLEKDVYTTFRYWPLHLVEGYGSDASLPNAEAAARGTLCIPIHQGLSDDDVDHVAEAVAALDRATVGT